MKNAPASAFKPEKSMKIFAAKQTLAAIRIDAYNSERSQRGTWEFQQKNSTS